MNEAPRRQRLQELINEDPKRGAEKVAQLVLEVERNNKEGVSFHICQIILFGSVSRDDPNPSDIDLLIILDDMRERAAFLVLRKINDYLSQQGVEVGHGLKLSHSESMPLKPNIRAHLTFAIKSSFETDPKSAKLRKSVSDGTILYDDEEE